MQAKVDITLVIVLTAIAVEKAPIIATMIGTTTETIIDEAIFRQLGNKEDTFVIILLLGQLIYSNRFKII